MQRARPLSGSATDAIRRRAAGVGGQAGLAFGYKTLSAALNYGLLAYAASQFGLRSAGILASVVAWTTLIATFSHLGHAVASTRFMAVLADDAHEMTQYSRQSVRDTAVGTVICSGILLAVLVASVLGGRGETSWLILLILLCQPGVTFHRLFEGASRGRGRIAIGLLPFSVLTPLLALGAMAISGWLGHGVWAPAVCYSVACLATSPAGAFATWSGVSLRRARTGPADRRSRIERRQVSLRLMVFSSAGFVIRQADVAVLSVFADAAEVGGYALVSRAAWMMSTVLFALNASSSPRLARQFALGNVQRVRNLFARLQRASAALMAVLGLALVAIVPVAEHTMGFSLSGRLYAALWLLVAGQVVSGIAGPVGALLNMIGAEKDTSRVAFAVTVLCILGTIGGAYWLGVVGVALAAASSLAVHNLLMTRIRISFMKRLG